jgi:sialate O-acetylesterase
MSIYLKCFFVYLCLIAGTASAEVRLPKLISDGMVLQRDARIRLWGWARPGEKVAISFVNKTYRLIAAADGKWQQELKPMKADGPYNMTITGDNVITINDILIGDVWFCSGQSNMVLPMERVKEKYPEEIAAAVYPQIRNFFIPTVSDVAKLHDDLPKSHWEAASPQTVLNFGAASWFFAKKLFDKYHVPIGIINSSVGGTPIQAWISADGIRQVPDYAARLKQLEDTLYLNHLLHPPVIRDTRMVRIPPPDKGLTGPLKWFDTTYSPVNWHHFWLPGYWADQGVRGLNGVVWFRKEITLPASVAGRPGKLMMGRMIDADQTYVNGTLVGGVTYQYPPRRYEIAPNVLKPGKNIIVIRLTNTAGKGGFVPDKAYFLQVGDQKIDIRGDWTYKVGSVFSPQGVMPGGPFFSAQNEPTGLYNTMVAPLIQYAVKGIVWYQGETNAGKPGEYYQLLTTLIADWRAKWQSPGLPFIYAQLPNFMEVQYSPSDSQWAVLREAQLKALAVLHTGMAVTIDAGEWNDIHPLDKKDVGERLALSAEKVAYGDDKVVASGPLFESARIDGKKIVITFSSTGSGLVAKGGEELTQFAIAGADKKFVWANAVISGNQVVVSSDDIVNPLYVRYAWADNPDGANLYNKEGLPASPFRTDTDN